MFPFFIHFQQLFLVVILVLIVPVASAAGDILVVDGARLYDGVNPALEAATLIVRDGKVAQVGQNIKIPRGATVINASGKTIIPGMMDNHSHMGFDPDDGNDKPQTLGPEHRIMDAISFENKMWQDAIEGGVTTVVTGPGSAENISGQAIVVKTFGPEDERRVIRYEGGLKIAMGPKSATKYPATAMGVAASLRSYFYQTQEYMARQQQWQEDDQKQGPPTTDLGYEAVAAVLRNENRIRAHVHSAMDVMTLLRLKDEFGFDLTLHHVTEAWKVADEIAKRNVNAVVIPLFTRRGLPDETMKGAYYLWQAGVRIALHTDHPVLNQKWLRLCAAMAMRYGLPELEALKAITINSAIIARVDGQTGSLEPGKDADFVIMNGPWYEPGSRIDNVYGRGKVIFDRSVEGKK